MTKNMLKELVDFLKDMTKSKQIAFDMVNESYRVHFFTILNEEEAWGSERIILELVQNGILDGQKEIYFGRGTTNYPYIVVLPLYEYNAFMGQIILTKDTAFDEKEREILLRGIDLLQTEMFMQRQVGACYQEIRVCDYMRILNADLPMEDRLLATIQKLKRDIHCELSLWTWMDETETLVPLVASKNVFLPDQQKEISHIHGKDFRIRALEGRSTVFLEKITADTVQEHQLLQTLGVTSTIAFPMLKNNEKQGVLVAYGSEEISHLSLYENVLREIATEIGSCIYQNKKWLQHIEKVMKMTTIHDIIQEVQQKELDFDEVMNNIVNIVPKVTGLSKCTIALIDINKEYLIPKYCTFKSPIEGMSYPLDKEKSKDQTGILAIEGKEPIIVYDASLDERCDPELANQLGILSNVTVPILDLQGEALGVMYLDNGDYRIFTEEQVEYYKILARQIGLIIANSKIIQKISRRAIKDGLTMLYNRRYIDKKYKEFLQDVKMYELEFSILMIDIDHFKAFNDTFGHSYGDEVLQGVAQQVTKAVRSSDIVGRYGGEEIMVLLPETSYTKACQIAERIREHVSSLLFKRQVTVSIGVANAPADGYDQILEKADEALYCAKNSGRNKVCGYHDMIKKEDQAIH